MIRKAAPPRCLHALGGAAGGPLTFLKSTTPSLSSWYLENTSLLDVIPKGMSSMASAASRNCLAKSDSTSYREAAEVATHPSTEGPSRAASRTDRQYPDHREPFPDDGAQCRSLYLEEADDGHFAGLQQGLRGGPVGQRAGGGAGAFLQPVHDVLSFSASCTQIQAGSAENQGPPSLPVL